MIAMAIAATVRCFGGDGLVSAPVRPVVSVGQQAGEHEAQFGAICGQGGRTLACNPLNRIEPGAQLRHKGPRQKPRGNQQRQVIRHAQPVSEAVGEQHSIHAGEYTKCRCDPKTR